MAQLHHVNPYGEVPAAVPIQPAGTAAQLFPPMCLRSHWDATQMLRYILPSEHVGLPLDPRPYVRICKTYRTSSPAVEAPTPPPDMVFPTGGKFYPPTRFSDHIDDESKLYHLDRTLDRWCQIHEFVPKLSSDMYVAGQTVPDRILPQSPVISELSVPQAVLRDGQYHCRAENDAVLWARSPRLWSNPTKQDKWGAQVYSALPGGVLVYPHGDAVPVPLTTDARRGAVVQVPMPGGSVPLPVYPAIEKSPDAARPIRVDGIADERVSTYAPAPPPRPGHSLRSSHAL